MTNFFDKTLPHILLLLSVGLTLVLLVMGAIRIWERQSDISPSVIEIKSISNLTN
jgi:hypothetical protein